MIRVQDVLTAGTDLFPGNLVPRVFTAAHGSSCYFTLFLFYPFLYKSHLLFCDWLKVHHSTQYSELTLTLSNRLPARERELPGQKAELL